MNLTISQSKHIQVLRGIAIIAVVFIHHTPLGLPQVLIRPLLNFCVGLFLFLSGFLSQRNPWNPKKRILKVIIPYILWTFVYVCANNISSLSQIPLSFGKSLILGDSAAIMYYVFVYCQFTMLIPLIDRLAHSKYKYLGFVISPLEIVLMRMFPIIFSYSNPLYLEKLMRLSCLGWFTYFYLGYLIGHQLLSVRYNNYVLTGALAIALILQVLEGYWYWTLGNSNCGTQLKLSSLFCSSVFVLLMHRFIHAERLHNLPLLVLLGNHSFGIYFSHLAVKRVFDLLLFYSTYIVYPFNAIVTLAVSFVLCFIGKKILKKYAWYIAL